MSTFNQHDALGALDFNSEGKLVLPLAGAEGKFKDKLGKQVNRQGYRINDEKSVINAKTGASLF